MVNYKSVHQTLKLQCAVILQTLW